MIELLRFYFLLFVILDLSIAMPETKLKSVCFKCHINKWIIDYRGGCADNVSSRSICLFCEQSEKIDKLERSLIERDSKITKLENLVNKLAKRVDTFGRARTEEESDSGECGRVVDGVSAVNENGNAGRREVCGQSCKLTQAMKSFEELKVVVMENRDTIVESGRGMVEIRREIASIKNRKVIDKVKGKNLPTKYTVETGNGVVLTNRFAILSEEDTYLVGDSLIGGK